MIETSNPQEEVRRRIGAPPPRVHMNIASDNQAFTQETNQPS